MMTRKQTTLVSSEGIFLCQVSTSFQQFCQFDKRLYFVVKHQLCHSVLKLRSLEFQLQFYIFSSYKK